MEMPNYYAIIPAEVRYDNDLRPNSKLLYGEITALCNKTGECWASNDYFAKLYNVDKSTISRWIKQLIDKGYVHSRIIYKEGTNQIDKRYMQISQEGIGKKVNTPIDEKVKDNITSINNTRLINKQSQKKELFNKIKEYFSLTNQNYYHIAKHSVAINNLINRFNCDFDKIVAVAEKHLEIKKAESKNTFWSGSPHTPASIWGKIDGILEYKLEKKTTPGPQYKPIKEGEY